MERLKLTPSGSLFQLLSIIIISRLIWLCRLCRHFEWRWHSYCVGRQYQILAILCAI